MLVILLFNPYMLSPLGTIEEEIMHAIGVDEGSQFCHIVES